MTAMSKSKMHAELISKAQSRAPAAAATVPQTQAPPDTAAKPEPHRDPAVLERKRFVGDILERSEPTSATKRLNEQRRRQFFENTPTAGLEESVEEAVATVAPDNEPAPSVEPVKSAEKVERPPRRKDKESAVTGACDKNENGVEAPASPKKSCIIS